MDEVWCIKLLCAEVGRTQLIHGTKYSALFEMAHGIRDMLKGWARLNTKVKPDPFGVGAWNQTKLAGGRHKRLTGKKPRTCPEACADGTGPKCQWNTVTSLFVSWIKNTQMESHFCSLLSISLKLPCWSYVQNQVLAYCPLPANFVTPPFSFLFWIPSDSVPGLW